MKNATFTIIFCFIFWNLSYAQETAIEVQNAFIEKYDISPYVTYDVDSSILRSVYIPYYAKEGAFFVDYYGKRKGKEVYDDIKIIKDYPFFWGKKNDKYFLYKFPATQILERSFDRIWSFGSMPFQKTYYAGPRGPDNEMIIFTETNKGNADQPAIASVISYGVNFNQEFDVNVQDLYPLIRLNLDSIQSVLAINGDKLYECTNCEIRNINNQKKFIAVSQIGDNTRIYDIVKGVFLEGEYNKVGRSSTSDIFYCLAEDPEQSITFFNGDGIKTFQTDYVDFNVIKDDIYYIIKKSEYQIVDVVTGDIIHTSTERIKKKVINKNLYILDEKYDRYYDPENTELEEMTSFETGEATLARIPKKEKGPDIRSRFFINHEGEKYNVATNHDRKYGWVRQDSSWIIEPKYHSVKKLGNDGLFVVTQRNGGQTEYGLLKFPDEMIYPFEKRKLSARKKFPFDLHYLVIEDFNSEIGVNLAFEVVYDPNKLFVDPNAFEWRDLDYSPDENIHRNEIIYPLMVIGDRMSSLIFDSKGNYLSKYDWRVKNVTSEFGFEDQSLYTKLPVMPLGEFRYGRQRKVILIRLEDGYIYKEY